MTLTYHKLVDLKPRPWNPRIMTEEKFIGLVRSIEEFGIVEPLIINNDGGIISGHMRYRACQQIGIDSIPCIELDLNDKREKKLNLTMNNRNIQGDFEDIPVAILLEEFKLDDDYDELRLNKLEPLDLSEVEELNLEDMDATEKPDTIKLPKINITFQSDEDKENARTEIEEIVFKYQGAYIK